MTTEPYIAREVDEILYSWRARVLSILLAFYSVVTLAPLFAVLTGRGIVLPWPLRSFCVALYLLVLVAALRPRWRVQRRAGMLLAVGMVAGGLQLAVGQLAGHGRVSLMVMPFLALLLVGPRAGWAAVALSAALFALVPVSLNTGWFSGWCVVAPGIRAFPPAYWGLQWILWLSALLILMILFSRFQALQRRTMIAERMALRQLEAETADRLRLEKEIGRIAEEERRRLGAELHDGLCQHLTASLLHGSALESQLKARGAPEAAEVTRLRQATEEAIGLAHDVAQGLCPVGMAPDALVPALERLCREVRDRRGLACRLQSQRDLAVRNPEHVLHLYRIASEAITNAVKHARCARITVELSRDGGTLMLQVSDDGKHLDSERQSGAGLGLRIMSYRAGLIGGAVSVTTGADGGTRVTCRVPDVEEVR